MNKIINSQHDTSEHNNNVSTSSKHQKYLKQLQSSNLTNSEIETLWNDYYQSLSNLEKHQVWKEFDEQRLDSKISENSTPSSIQRRTVFSADMSQAVPKKQRSKIKNKLKITKKHKHPNTKSTTKNRLTSHNAQRHLLKLKSLFVGISVAMIVVLILSFGFFNEKYIVPFIRPSSTITSTSIINSPNTPVGLEPKIIVPKINTEVPVVYDEPSYEEDAIQKALERGVVHYGTSAMPGEAGNNVIVGHSSNNLFNPGKYKFAFVLLNKLEIGDTFYLDKDGVRYIYKIYNKKIVQPNDVSVLNPDPARTAITTLITCDPPGTNYKRLIIQAEQVSPEPSSIAQNTHLITEETMILPGNSESLFSRLTNWLF